MAVRDGEAHTGSHGRKFTWLQRYSEECLQVSARIVCVSVDGVNTLDRDSCHCWFLRLFRGQKKENPLSAADAQGMVYERRFNRQNQHRAQALERAESVCKQLSVFRTTVEEFMLNAPSESLPDQLC